MRAIFSGTLGLAAGGMALTAAEPVLTHVHPAALQAGTTGVVSLAGTFDPWPCQIHASMTGLTFVPQKDPGNFEVTVAASVPPGPCLLRAYNDDGASAPVAFMIAASPQTLETEPNDDFRSPQILTSQTGTLNGRLDKADDVDSYQISLRAGQTFVAWAEAHVLAAGFDAMLRLVDAHGSTLAFNHDGPSSIDPVLVFTAPVEGAYTIQIMGHKYPAASDIRFAGGKDCVYRLHFSTGPLVRHPWPLAAPKEGMVSVAGWNLTGQRIAWHPDTAFLYPMEPGFPVEWTEASVPGFLTPSSAVSGQISAPGEEDRYPFKAAKDETLEFFVTGPGLGSEIDPWVKIRNGEGKELASNDDAAGSTESRLEWKAPEDGVFFAAVGDLTQRGGPDYYYRLALSRPAPGVTATSEPHAFKIKAGESVPIKVKVGFSHGFAVPLTLQARCLPEGVTAAPATIPPGGGEVELTLKAPDAASPASQPFQLVLQPASGLPEFFVVHRLISTSENNGVPQGFKKLLIPETQEFWLTVSAPPAPVPPKDATPPAPPPP